MQLGEMNTLTAAKLNADMKNRVGWNFGQLGKMSIAQASEMLESIDSKISAVKGSTRLHESQKDPNYNALIIAKQVLESHINEKWDAQIAANHKRGGMFEDGVGQAESLMAAQDMVDSLQSNLTDVSKMLNEELPPLVDSLRSSHSAEQAAAFNDAATAALNAYLEATRAARQAMDSAVMTLTGQEAAPMTTPDMGDDMDMDMGDDMDMDMDDMGDDTEEDEFAASDAAVGGTDEPLGRAKRA
jgi:hypothetical protein